jgi:hypothetical protein
MRRPPTRTQTPPRVRKRKTDHWSPEDEELLRAGVWRYASPPNVLAERRRLSVDEFWKTIPARFGGMQPPDEREERDNE